jgi:hypothetical protein
MKDVLCLAAFARKILCLAVFIVAIKPVHIATVQAARKAVYCETTHGFPTSTLIAPRAI